MRAITSAGLLATLACSAQGFIAAPAPARAGVAQRARLNAEDFVPSETWMREYFAQDGLRYNQNKTDKEIETEGDYTLWESIFGATSNNAAKMKLKAEARKKAKEYSNEQESQFWLKKYGHPRFFPAYIDKSGENELPAEAASPLAAAQAAVDTPVKAAKGLFKKQALPDEPEMAKAVSMPDTPLPLPIPAKVAPTVIKGGRSGPSTPYETNPGNPRDLPGDVTTAPKASSASGKKASTAPKAGKVIAAKVAEAPAAAADAADRLSRAAARTVAKAKGNLDNLPKRSGK